MTAEAVRRPVDAEWERSKVGDRLIAFTVLLPARVDRAVVIAVDDPIAPYLAHRFPDAIVLVRDDGAVTDLPPTARPVRWDGVHSPLRPQSIGLAILDSRVGRVDALAASLAPDGVVAMLGDAGEWVVYPSLNHPEHVWRREWPTPVQPSVRAQLRRLAGLRLSALRGAPRLSVAGAPFDSLAELICADVAAATGRPARLVGIEAAGRTILRVRGAEGDLAVRLSLCGARSDGDPARQVHDEVPAARRFVLEEVASGTTAGIAWSAGPWRQTALRRPADIRRAGPGRWQVAAELADALARAPIGTTEPGWAQRWVAGVPMIPAEVSDRFASLLQPLDDAFPTGWCHGDLWPANVVIDRTGAAVIDWENAVPDAPLGLDWLLLAGLRRVRGDRATMAHACVAMLAGALSVPHDVCGRPFASWPAEVRTALVVATFVHYLRNRSLHDLGAAGLAHEVSVMLAGLDAAAAQPASPGRTATSRAARGAAWLGLGAAIVKGAQTAALLVIAALLAPSALGVLALGAMITNIGQTLSDMGVSTGLIYSRRDPARTAGTAVTLSAATSLVMTVAAWVAAPALAHGLHAAPDATWVIRGLVSVLPLYGIAAVPQELLRRELAFARRIVPDVVAALVGGAVSVCLVLAGHGLAGVVIGQIVQAVVTLVLSWIIGRVVLPAWDPTVAAELVRYGANLAAASLLGLVLLNVDYVLVSRVLGAQALGQYSLAFRLAYLPFVNIAFVIAGAGFPYLCRLVDRDIGPAVERMIAAGMSVVVPVCAAMAVFARQVELLGTKWAPAVGVVRWLAVYAALLALVQFVYTALNAVGNPGATLSLRLLHLVTLLVVLPIAVRHGIETVAIGQVIGGTVAVVAAFVVAQRKVPGWRLGAVARGLLPAVAGAGAMALVGVVLQQLLASTAVSVSGFVWVGALAGCAYLGLVVLLGGRDLKRSIDTLRGRP